MVRARVEGVSDEGWPTFDPDSVSDLNDASEGAFDPSWAAFSKQVFGVSEEAASAPTSAAPGEVAGQDATKAEDL